RKSSHRTIFLIVPSGSPLALIASSLRSTSKKPVCPMTRSLHPPMAHCGQRVRFVATWREEFFEVPIRQPFANFVEISHRASQKSQPELAFTAGKAKRRDQIVYVITLRGGHAITLHRPK